MTAKVLYHCRNCEADLTDSADTFMIHSSPNPLAPGSVSWWWEHRCKLCGTLCGEPLDPDFVYRMVTAGCPRVR